MSDILRKSMTSKGLTSKMDMTVERNTETFLLIESEYIKNLQKQVYLLELETSFLRKQARKATGDQPRLTAEAEQMVAELKDLQSQISSMHLELAMKENSISVVKEELKEKRRHLHNVSDKNIKEKTVLVEDITQVKKLADVSTQDLTHKDEEHKSILHELHNIIQSVKEKERELLLLQTQLQEQTKQHEAVEAQLAARRSECLSVQATILQLEEQYVSTAQSVQERIVLQLRKEAEKLRTRLKEKQLAADEDKYLRKKLAEDCGRLTKGNAHLLARVLETNKELEEERQLRENESLNLTRRISELVSGKENERQLELKLSHWRRLVQEEKERVVAAQEQVLQLQDGRKSVEMAGSSLYKQLTDLQNKHSGLQQENSLLRVEKNHLVEHISQLHKQIAEKNDEIRFMRGHVDSLCSDFNSLKLHRDLDESSGKPAWQQLSSVLRGIAARDE